MKLAWTPLTLAALTATSACTPAPSPDLDALRAELLQLHESSIQAHLAKDATFLAESISPEYLAVSDGSVRQESPEEVRAAMEAYLGETEFSHYEDTSPPLIGLSDDGSLAWVIAQMRVAGTREREGGDLVEYDTQWAWISVFRRTEDGWMRVSDVSTSRPFDSSGGELKAAAR